MAEREPSACLYVQTRRELGTAVELAAAVQRCGERDLGKAGVGETCPWCVEAVLAVMKRTTPTRREVMERWMHLPARE